MKRLAAFVLIASSLVMPVSHAAEADRTPDAVLNRLKEGNKRYLAGTSQHARIDAERRMETAASGQRPYSTVLGCSDSRVPVEIVFDQGFAEVFVVRVAGNVCGEAELASVEYGANYLGTPLVVVLGHSQCGAVDGAVSEAQLSGNLPHLLEMIRPAVEAARNAHPGAKGTELLDAAIEANVRHTIEELLRGSSTLRKQVSAGNVKIVGAIRELSTGEVRWLDASR